MFKLVKIIKKCSCVGRFKKLIWCKIIRFNLVNARIALEKTLKWNTACLKFEISIKWMGYSELNLKIRKGYI